MNMVAVPRIQIAEAYAPLLTEDWRHKSFYGGRGAARSWSVARALLIKTSVDPLRVLCTREHQSSIKDSVHKLLKDQIEKCQLGGWYVTDKSIRSPVGGEFMFKGLRHNIEDIKSMEGIDICWIEEAERTSEESWKTLIPTIRKPGSEIWSTWNVNTEDDPTYKRLVENPPPTALVRKTSWRDNPWFPEVLRQEMEYDFQVDPDAAMHIWEGEPKTNSDAQVLNGKWIVDEFTPGADWDGPYYGADWGFATDPTVLIRLWIHDKVLYVEYEAYQVGCEITKTGELFESAVPEAKDHLIRADSARPETISHVKSEGFRIEAAPKWSGSVEDGITFLRSFRRIVIHPRCKHAKQEAKLWSYKTDRLTGDVLPRLEDKHDHTWDAARYALAPLIKRKQKWGVA